MSLPIYTSPTSKPPPGHYTPTRQACWICSKQLLLITGKGFSYRIYPGPDGNDHKVHLDCLKAETGGYDF